MVPASAVSAEKSVSPAAAKPIRPAEAPSAYDVEGGVGRDRRVAFAVVAGNR